MRYTIQLTADGWVLARGDGAILTQIGDPHATYNGAVEALSAELAAIPVVPVDGIDPAEAGLLPDHWVDDGGLAMSEALPGGRDFTNCAWTWRDPAACLVPLMLQTETDYGHMGAELAGFVEEFSLSGGTVHGTGRFYDSDIGIAARDLLLGDRRFGVSVDPSEAVESEFQCTEVDEDGWCMEGITAFLAYEIAGVTMTPFPGFATAAIVLDAGAGSDAGDAAIAASSGTRSIFDAAQSAVAAAAVVARRADAARARVPVAPPADWFELPEPQMGEPFLGTLGEEFLVDQGDGTVAVPLQITDDGQVFGHVARWDQCHIGDPAGPGICVAPPRSLAAYQHFHVGEVRLAGGERLATGALTVGCEHADLETSSWLARDHYANAGNGWADVRATNGEYGVWISGALRPGVDEAQLRILRALSLSGDWRKIGLGLELIAALSVNVPGFPIARDALAASGMAITAAAMPGARSSGGEPTALVASGIVARCPDCQKRQQDALAAGGSRIRQTQPDPRIDRVLTLMEMVERRTRHFVEDEAESLRARLRPGASR